MTSYKIIKGNTHSDTRGELNFFNDFDMKEIVRMYEISPKNKNELRGWQGHKKEHKWFYCSKGSFTLFLSLITDFNDENNNLPTTKILLEAKKPSIVHITGGYATAFKANEENAKLLVFSNATLEASIADDFRFNLEKWPVNLNNI